MRGGKKKKSISVEDRRFSLTFLFIRLCMRSLPGHRGASVVCTVKGIYSCASKLYIIAFKLQHIHNKKGADDND